MIACDVRTISDVIDEQVLFDCSDGRLRAVVEGSGEARYVTTNNSADPAHAAEPIPRIVPA